MSLVVLSFFAVVSAARADFVQIVAFGDSLSDTGNLFAASGGTSPPAPYFNGHFSNGPIWLESLAGKLGVPNPTPSASGGTSYAWASAETGTGVSPTLSVPNLLTQVNGFTLKNKLTSKDLVTIWAGGNDFLNGQTNPFVPINNITAAITNLSKVGGKTFLVPNLPLLDHVPFSLSLPPAQQAGLHALTIAYNTNLKTQLNQLQNNLGVTIYQVDIASLFNNIQSSSAHFGFSNVTSGAVGDGVLDGKIFSRTAFIQPARATL